MSRLSLVFAAVLLLVAACTRNPDAQVVQVPTLASLPTEAATTEIPATRPPTVTPTVTLTSTSTDTPTSTPTPTIASTPTVSVLPTMTQRPEGDLSGWIVLTQVSPFDDSVLYGVVRDADTPANTWLGEVTPTLFFRCNKGVFDVFITIKARLENPADLTDQVHVKLRYDQEPTVDAVMNTLNQDESGAGFLDAQATLKDMLAHKKLAFGFTPDNSPFTYTSFTLDGLEIALQPVLKACNIPDPVTQ